MDFKVLSAEEIEALKAKVQETPLPEVVPGEVAIIETEVGSIVFELLPDIAPMTAANFKRLAETGFYNGTTFHRIVPGFVIQGGDILSRDANPDNDGTGNPGYRLKAEFSDYPHVRGTVSMARGRDPNSAGSQFFICVADAPHLDRQYTAFGRVIKGMEVVDAIVGAPREKEKPLKPVRMINVEVKFRDEVAE
jgi:cyclophilin family peptidyl-prolyl cis-trans isomerase